MVCGRLKPAVSGLEQDFPGKVTARNVDASAPGSAEAIQSLGFRTHGLVARDASGAILLKQPDHTVDVEAVRKALRQALGS